MRKTKGLVLISFVGLLLIAATSRFSDTVQLFDQVALMFGGADRTQTGDFYVSYDETTDDRLEVTDGTNLLMHYTDSGTTGNLNLNGGDLTIDDLTADDITMDTLALTTPLPVASGGTGAAVLDDVVGTTDQITVTNGADSIIGGNVTLSLPSALTVPGSLTTTTTFATGTSATVGSTLGVTGNTTLTNGTLLTGAASSSLFNTTATTLNIGGAATTLTLGAATGTATIANATVAITNAATVGSTLGVTGVGTFTNDIAVNGGDITSTSANGMRITNTTQSLTLTSQAGWGINLVDTAILMGTAAGTSARFTQFAGGGASGTDYAAMVYTPGANAAGSYWIWEDRSDANAFVAQAAYLSKTGVLNTLSNIVAGGDLTATGNDLAFPGNGTITANSGTGTITLDDDVLVSDDLTVTDQLIALNDIVIEDSIVADNNSNRQLYMGAVSTAGMGLVSETHVTVNIDADANDTETEYFAVLKNGGFAGGTEIFKVEADGRINAGIINLGNEAVPTTLTIASGSVAFTKGVHYLAGEGGVADSLTNITGGSIGDEILIYPSSNIVDITVDDAGGNFVLNVAGDFVMNNLYDCIRFRRYSAGIWVEVSRSDNGA